MPRASENMSNQKENQWSSYAFRIIVSTASHPLEYAKVLIQLGHEPIAPRPTKTFFRKPALKLPNIFEYVKYIKSVDGFVGCYRGVGPRVCGNLFSALASQRMLDCMNLHCEEDCEEIEEDEEEKRREQFIKSVKRDFVSRMTAIVVSHPFHVVTIRMMAQFIGGEDAYQNAWACVIDVYKQNGVLGFFSGLVPRILGDALSLILASGFSYILNTYVFDERDVQMYTSATMSFVASALTYPFQVVANCMAVVNSGLVAGSPPFMPNYLSWTDCWADLSRRGHLKRGSSVLIRYYTGPQIIINDRAVPLKESSFQVSR